MNPVQSKLSLEDVVKNFTQWRSTKKNKVQKTPQYLWEQVQEIIPSYSLKTIATQLKIKEKRILSLFPESALFKDQRQPENLPKNNFEFQKITLLPEPHSKSRIEVHFSSNSVLKIYTTQNDLRASIQTCLQELQ